jgi:hypothetical protein
MRAKLDVERLMEACRECGVGFCVACGAEHDGVEPDARGDECEECGLAKVYGAEECLLMGYAS